MKKCSHDSGCTIVLNALATTMEMSGLSQLSQIFKRQQEQGSIEYREWAEETWEAQKPRFCSMWNDGSEGGGRALIEALAWEDESLNKLCDTMEVYGIVDITASKLRQIMHSIVKQNTNNTNSSVCISASDRNTDAVTTTADYLDAYRKPCPEQTLFTNDFLQWQIRFGNMEYLLDSDQLTEHT